MTTLTIRALKTLLALALLGSLLLQFGMLPLMYHDMTNEPADVEAIRLPFVIVVGLGLVTTQVVMVCLWRLSTMVRRGTVFSPDAFRYVDLMIGAFAAASVLLFVLGAVLAPGETVAPGMVLLVGCAGGVVAGIALVVVMMRSLLVQAVARDAEASHLQSELDEVI